MPGMSPAFSRRVDELSAASDRTWLVGASVGLALTLVAAYAPLPTLGGTACAYLGLLVRSALYVRSRETLAGRGGETLSRLFELGLVAGLFELIVDWWLIHGVSSGRLEYLGPDVVLLTSPVWMPVAWACVIVEMGYPAVRLFGLLRARVRPMLAAVAATLTMAIAAGVTVGFYEFFAARAGWWRYGPANAMIGETCALFIPLGEVFMFCAILPVASRALSRDDRRVATAIECGAMFAAAIFAGYAIAYALLEWGR